MKMVRRHKFCDFYTSSDLFQGFRFTEEEHEILKSLLVHDGDDDSYTLRVPGSYWLGGWKFTMVSEWGEAGARLYHKLRDGLEPELAAHRASAGRSIPESQELAVTIRRSDEERDTYAVGKIETCRGHQVISEHRMDWKQLAMEAACPRRTRIPPSLLFIKGHAKFEGQKLANIHSRSKTQPKKKGRKLYTSTAPRLNKEVIGELLRTVAYIAEREEEGTVNYTTLQADFLKPMANKSALQELGRDFHRYIENSVKTIIDKKLSHTDSISS